MACLRAIVLGPARAASLLGAGTVAASLSAGGVCAVRSPHAAPLGPRVPPAMPQGGTPGLAYGRGRDFHAPRGLAEMAVLPPVFIPGPD